MNLISNPLIHSQMNDGMKLKRVEMKTTIALNTGGGLRSGLTLLMDR